MAKLLYNDKKHLLNLDSVNSFYNEYNYNNDKIKYLNIMRKKKRKSLTKILLNSENNSYHYYQNNKILLVNWFLVMLLLCDHLILVQSRKLLCTPCEIKAEIGSENALPAKAAYEEYVFEHQVTRQQAINALLQLNESFFDGPTNLGCKAFDCNKHLKYCLGSHFLNDHCFCEQSHTNEGLPFIPHSCYVGEEITAKTKPWIGSCFRFAEIKECCCVRPLAKRWKYLSSSTNLRINFILIILTSVIVFLNNCIIL